MKIGILLITTLFIFSATTAQRMSDVELSQKISGIVTRFISTYDLSEQSPADPKCEGFKSDTAIAFVSLFRNDPDNVQIPNLFSSTLIEIMTEKATSVSRKNIAETYVTLNDYIVKMREDKDLKAFTYVPEEKTLVINYIKKNRRISGNLLMTVVGFEFTVTVCRQENVITFNCPTEITFVYEEGSTPKIEKVLIRSGRERGQWNYDFYISPYAEYSGGKVRFDKPEMEGLKSATHNYGFGALLMLNIPGVSGNLTKYLYSGIEYDINVFKSELDSYQLSLSDVSSPFDYADGVTISDYVREINIQNLKETSNLGVINIPLGLNIDYKLGKVSSRRHLFVNPSVKIGIPLNYTTKYAKDGNADYVGHYSVSGTQIPKFDVVIDDGYNFGYDFQLESNNLNDYSKILVSGEFEMGYRYFYNKSWSLNLSGFLNYTFTNLFGEQVGSGTPVSMEAGKCYSVPYLLNPSKSFYYGLKLSVHSFAFQLKSKSKSIENVKKIQ